jgi:hypothetical protein
VWFATIVNGIAIHANKVMDVIPFHEEYNAHDAVFQDLTKQLQTERQSLPNLEKM